MISGRSLANSTNARPNGAGLVRWPSDASEAIIADVVRRGSFAVNGRALTLGEATGLVKLVVDADDGVVVGAGIAGPDASELVAELTLAIECALRLDDLLGTIHAHPTLAEAIVDAARSADRRLQRARSR